MVSYSRTQRVHLQVMSTGDPHRRTEQMKGIGFKAR